MTSVKLTVAVSNFFAVLLVFALSSKGVRGQPGPVQCQALAFELYAFAKPSDSFDCKQACDERFADLRKMPNEQFAGVNHLSVGSETIKARADAHGIFWIDQCVAWLRYCFRQRAAILTIDKNALGSQHPASTGPALTCLCRSVFLLMQVRKYYPDVPKFCEQEKICERLAERLNFEHLGLWSCRQSQHVTDISCSKPVPMCPCCRTRKPKTKTAAVSCPNWPAIDKLLNEPFVLGDQEWEAFDLHGAPQPEEGFLRGTVLEPQGPACPLEQEDTPQFKAASLPIHIFDSPGCGQAGTCAAESSASGTVQMHSHFEATIEARERMRQSQEWLRPPQKQQKKRKAVAAADASCSIEALASIGQSQSDLTSLGSQFPEAYPFPFTTMNDGEAFWGSQFVSAQTTGGEDHSMGSGASGIDSDNLQFGQVFAEAREIDAEHATVALDPDNLQFSDYFGAAGSIPPADSSNPDDLAKETQDSLNAFDGIP